MLNYRPRCFFRRCCRSLKGGGRSRVELITDDTYQRSVACGEHVGWVRAGRSRASLPAGHAVAIVVAVLPLIVVPLADAV